MIETFVLILFAICSIFVSIKNANTQFFGMNLHKSILSAIFIGGIVLPLYEESIFRSVIKQYLMGFEYGNIINALIFGISHGPNYRFHSNHYITLYQIISTSYLGYYVVQFDDFHMAFIVHSLYNIFIVISVWLCVFKNSNNVLDSGYFISYGSNEWPQFSNLQRRLIYICKSKTTKEIQEIHDKMDNIMTKKLKKKQIDNS